MSSLLEKLKGWLGRTAGGVEDEVGGAEPATTPRPSTAAEQETSTNAQVEGASDEPFSGS
jgi:hypothetical protein